MSSLFESLGLSLPGNNQPEKKLSAREFCRKIVNSTEFRLFIVEGLVDKKLHPSVVSKLMEYAWGKVPDKIEFEDKTKAIENASPEALEQRLLVLADLARRQRMNEAAVQDESDPPDTPSSIH